MPFYIYSVELKMVSSLDLKIFQHHWSWFGTVQSNIWYRHSSTAFDLFSLSSARIPSTTIMIFIVNIKSTIGRILILQCKNLAVVEGDRFSLKSTIPSYFFEEKYFILYSPIFFKKYSLYVHTSHLFPILHLTKQAITFFLIQTYQGTPKAKLLFESLYLRKLVQYYHFY